MRWLKKLSTILNPWPPVLRLAAAMRNGNDINQVAHDGINNGKRKFPQHKMSQIIIEMRAQLRILQQDLNSSLNFVAEAVT
jgi:hypothetical protein